MADDMVKHLRTLGVERAMFGSNYVFSDLLPEKPAHSAGHRSSRCSR